MSDYREALDNIDEVTTGLDHLLKEMDNATDRAVALIKVKNMQILDIHGAFEDMTDALKEEDTSKVIVALNKLKNFLGDYE